MVVITCVTNCLLSFPISSYSLPNFLHINNAPHREYLLTPLQATDTGGTITMVTASGRSFTPQIEDTAVQETNPAIPGQLVPGN